MCVTECGRYDAMSEEGLFEVRACDGSAFSFGCSSAFYIDYFLNVLTYQLVVGWAGKCFLCGHNSQ